MEVPEEIENPIPSPEWSNKFIYQLEEEFGSIKLDRKHIEFKSTFSRPSINLIDKNMYINLIETKNQIDIFKNQKKMYLWDSWSKSVNPYEKIKSFSNIHSTKSISRAFFKLWEILHIFGIPPPQKSLSLCEAPGGFVSCVINYSDSRVDWYAQTLYVGDCLKVYDGLDKSRWIKNGDGDMTNPENIRRMAGVEYDLVTGDGGFSVDFDPNNQEQYSFRLIVGEFLGALALQSEGGNFVCKLFDTVTKPTVQLLVIMKRCYNRVYLVKPRTSRYTNSEKYIVCLGLKNRELVDVYVKHMYYVMDSWVENHFCRNLGIKGVDLSFINEYNMFLSQNQIIYIGRAIKYSTSQNKMNILNYIETIQNKKANVFCVEFGLSANKLDCNHGYSYVKANKHLFYGITSNKYVCSKCFKTIYI